MKGARGSCAGSPHVQAAAAAIGGRWDGRPEAALVLGTGLHQLSGLIQAEAVIPYPEIPHFPRSTAVGHSGRLVCGRFGGRSVIAMDGRCHGYEGYSQAELTLPVLVMRALGAELLILSNASGGLNPKFASGDVVVVSDHISLLLGLSAIVSGGGCEFRSPSPGGEPARQGALSAVTLTGRRSCRPVYDAPLIEQALDIARREAFAAHRGVYVAMTGPNYETRAEYRFLQRIGGDVVGMSTVPEAVAASGCGLRTLALSIVTNVARPDSPEVVCATDVIRAAERAEPHVREIMAQVVAQPWPENTSS
ncbi:MAG: purine-nucleoside phosphorylase [Pirellulaceae bacterium]|jgi:purine-nucleoside phosphorylase|nr:purine-nucleoside phosphorylase [Pirellulaceae bacterium]MCU0978394.1 purine-nucleoside phosphorylase [Pirellulaceae bacterium]